MAVLFEQFTNFGSTSLSSPATAGSTSISVNDATNFPATGQFRVVIDNEVFLVTGVTGTTFTVTPGYENTTQANHNTGATVSCVVTAGVMNNINNRNLGTLNYLEYFPGGENSFADQTTQIQNFLLYCQLVAFTMKPLTGLDDQIQSHYVTAVLPYGTTRTITSPIVVPEFVNLKDLAGMQRNGTAGTVTSSYNGDTTSLACANLWQPGVIIVPDAHCENLNLYDNPDGVHLGSALAVGKNWVAAGATVVSGGAGYHVGDVLRLAQPSKAPYFATFITVNSVDGNGAVLTFSVNPGAYALPDKLQQQQWTAANGFTGAIASGSHGQVFDGVHPGAFITAGGNGTGATFTQQWRPDWNGVSTMYDMGAQTIGDTRLGKIRCLAVGKSPDPTVGDATYGFKFGVLISNLNVTFDDIGVGGGDWSIAIINASDTRGNILNPVGGAVLLKLLSSGSIECPNVVLDTPSHSALDIDACQAVRIAAQGINPVSSPTLTSGYAMRIGSQSTTKSVNVTVELDLENFGSLAGVPAAYFANMADCHIDVTVGNHTSNGNNGTHLLTRFCDFGTGITLSNRIGGQFSWGSQTPASLFSGTLPGCGLRVWNDSVNGSGVGGYTDEGGNYAIKGAAAPTTGTWLAGDRVVNNAPSAGGNEGWICVTGGSPGTWKSYGAIAS